jgi:lambda family phage portal protein
VKLLDFFRGKPAPRRPRRAFDAANTGRLFADWLTLPKSADSDIRYTLKAMRARSRDLAQNNDYARRYLDLVAVNVVGPKGITLQVRAREPNGILDQVANQQLERAFYDWGKPMSCTVDGRLSWVDCQKVFMDSVVRDGECFVLFVEDNANPYRFRLQFIDPDLIDQDKNDILSNGNLIRMGVEVTPEGRPVAYYVKTRHPDDYQTGAAAPVREQRIPAERMIHAFRQDRIGQTRGTPWTTTAMTRLKMLGGYEESELVAARISASKMGFFTSEAGDDYQGNGEDGDGTIRMELQPGTFEQLPAGVEFKPFDPQHPSTAFRDFEKAMLRGIASGLGVSYTSLANDLEAVSYSSIRQGLLEERDFWRTVQFWMIEHFCQPVYERWLRQALDAGVLNLPATKYFKFRSTQWVPRGWQWVDPRNEAEAQITAINAGLMTRTQALAERGLDIEDVLRERQAEDEMIAEFDINLTGNAPAQPVPVPPPAAGGE